MRKFLWFFSFLSGLIVFIAFLATGTLQIIKRQNPQGFAIPLEMKTYVVEETPAIISLNNEQDPIKTTETNRSSPPSKNEHSPRPTETINSSLYEYFESSDQNAMLSNKHEINENELIHLEMPSKITFDKLEKSSEIVPIYSDENGVIMLPNNSRVVGMYVGGSYPGYPGNTIIAGHNNYSQKIGLFNYLTELEIGDTISFTYKNEFRVFKVSAKEIYSYDSVPESTFDLTGESRITMISCFGKFNKKLNTAIYRCVVVAVPEM